MKLYTSTTSPYARKVRIVLLEKGLSDAVEEIIVNPFEDPADLRAVNPLGKVPALILPDGEAIFDSSVICGFLDTLGGAPRLIPEPPAAWSVLTGEALGNGMLDALFALVIERRRLESERSPAWQSRWRSAVLRSADKLEHDPAALAAPLSIAQITWAAALGYADFRTPEIDWRANRPLLADWYARFATRPSMQATAPPG